MIALSDADLAAVINAASVLHPADRDPFLRAVADELMKLRVGELGPGSVARVVRQTQKQFFRPPSFQGNLHSGKHGR